MLNAEFLLDDFHKRGNDAMEFEELLTEIDNHTTYRQISLKNLTIYNLMDLKYQDQKGFCKAFIFEPANPWVTDEKSKPKALRFSLDYVLPHIRNTEMYDKKLYVEMMSDNSIMVATKEDGGSYLYHMSSHALATLAQRIGITSNAIADRSFAASMMIAQKLNQRKTAMMVVKSYRRIGKIYAFLGSKYARLPLREICAIYRDLFGENPKISKVTDASSISEDSENVICEDWEITHEKVTIRFALNGYAKDVSEAYKLGISLIPCLELTTSDIGESAFQASGYWKLGNGAKIYTDSFKREHRGGTLPASPVSKQKLLDSNEFSDAVKDGIKESIFDKYGDFPKRLKELMQIPITPENEALDKRGSVSRNRQAIMKACRYVEKQLQLLKVAGKGGIKALRDQLECTIEEEKYYTAYDLVMLLYNLLPSITEKMKSRGICDESIRKFVKAMGRAAYVDFASFSAKEKKAKAAMT